MFQDLSAEKQAFREFAEMFPHNFFFPGSDPEQGA